MRCIPAGKFGKAGHVTSETRELLRGITNRIGEILRCHCPGGVQGARSGARVFQLPDVSWPIVLLQPGNCLGGEDWAYTTARVDRAEMLDQGWNVFLPLTQGRQVKMHDVEPIKEIFAELSLLDQRSELFVGGSHDSNIDLDRRAFTDSTDLPFLESPQALRLNARTNIPHLAQKQRTSAPFFNHP